MTERLRAVPPLLWVVIGALVLAAVTTIGPIVSGLSSTWGGGVGLVVIILPWLCVMAVPVIYARVAWALVEGSRTARAFTVVLAAVFVLLAAVGLGGGFAVVAALLLAGATTVFAAPSTRAFFDGPLAHGGSRPPTMAVTRAALLTGSALAAGHAALMLVTGLAMLAISAAASSSGGATGGALGMLGGVFSGLVLLEVAVATATAGLGVWAARGLERGNRTARTALTIGVGVEALPVLWFLVVAVSAEAGSPLGVAVAAFFALHLVAAIAPWLFPDARRHVGEPPLPMVDDLHRRLVDVGARSATAAPAGPAAAWPTPPSAPAAVGPPSPAPSSPSFPALRPAPPTASSRHARPVGSDDATSASGPFRETTPSGRHARPEAAAAMTCASCGAASQPGWSHCPHCGARTSGRPTPGPRP